MKDLKNYLNESSKGKKYEFVPGHDDEFEGHTVHLIRALKKFTYEVNGVKAIVNKGDIGGYIESEDNLSQEGNCWVEGDSFVTDNAKVMGDAVVCSNSVLADNAVIKDHAFVGDNTTLRGDSMLSDYASVGGGAEYKDITLDGNESEWPEYYQN